ncbi:methylmalonate-semialdehyde dehydrogenase, partial [Sesbania bispinosa]
MHVDSLDAAKAKKFAAQKDTGGDVLSDQLERIRQGVQPPKHYWKRIDIDSSYHVRIPAEEWIFIRHLNLETELYARYIASTTEHKSFNPPKPLTLKPSTTIFWKPDRIIPKLPFAEGVNDKKKEP